MAGLSLEVAQLLSLEKAQSLSVKDKTQLVCIQSCGSVNDSSIISPKRGAFQATR